MTGVGVTQARGDDLGEETLARTRAGDPEALSLLYARFSGDLIAVARRLLGSKEDAEDVLHDLFVGLPELLARYKHDGRLGGWLRQVVLRLALMRLREQARRDRNMLITPEAKWDNTADRLDLARALDLMPPGTRAVFVLRQVEGFSHEEIAALLDISPGASRVRYVRAIRQLRTLLGE